MSQDRKTLGIVVIGVLLGLAAIGFLLFSPAPTAPEPAPSVSGQTPSLEGPRTPGPTAPVASSSIATSSFEKPSGPDVFTNNLQVGGSVRNRKGAPVQGALVELVSDLSSMINRTQEGDVRAQITSDERGQFTFDPMSMTTTERFLLRVSHAAYATARIPDIDPRRPESLNRDVILDDGTSVSGVVKDTDGRPIPSVKVTFYDLGVQAWDPDGAVEKSVVTDASGAYKALSIVPGMKKVAARVDGYATAGRATLMVEAGKDLANVDIILTRGKTISGMIVASDTNTPVAGAMISARVVRFGPADAGKGIDLSNEEALRERRARMERGEEVDDGGDERVPARRPEAAQAAPQLSPSRFPNSVPADTARSGPDGRFEVKGLEEGSYVLTVIATGYMSPQQPTVETGAADVSIMLTPNARILGQVVDEDTNAPIPAFTVALSASADAALISPTARKAFGPPQWSDGRYEYLDVRQGTWWLLAEAPGYAGGRSEAVTISQGERRENVQIRLSKGATVIGRVVDSAGKPVVDATVEAEPQGNGGVPRNPFTDLLQQQMRREVKSARTGADGVFRVSSLMEGDFQLVVKHPDFAPFKSDTFPVPRRGETTRPDMALIRGGTIRGRVKGAGGTGDPKAMVQITPAVGGTFSQRQAYTGPDGRFEASGLAAGTYYVTVPMQNGQFNLAGILAGAAKRTNEGQTVVTLTEGQVVDLDL